MAGKNDSPPFATSDGKPAGSTAGGGGSKPTDFTRNTRSDQAPAVPGRDFTKESRDQSLARPEVVPAKGEIPAGGKDLKADPSGKAGNSGDIDGVNEKAPYKGLK